jgi:hypothetical protein
MILPGKHLKHDRALLGIGAELLILLDEPRTISELWERVRKKRDLAASPLSFDWFVLSLTLLYATTAISFDGTLINRATNVT